MNGEPRLLVLSPALHGDWRSIEPGAELAVFGSPEEVTELARRAAAGRTWAHGLRPAGRARTLAEHTFVHRARDLEALWTA